MEEEDLSAVLVDDSQLQEHDSIYQNAQQADANANNNAGNNSNPDLSATAETGTTNTSGAAAGPSQGGFVRRHKSPSYSSSSRMRTPYERPSTDNRGGNNGGNASGAGDAVMNGGDDSNANDGGNKYTSSRRAPHNSRRECRVYVGNLAYEVGWQDLKDYMRKVGEVVFADILTLPNGRSKGCGVVEYTTPEEAQKAITELNDTQLMGRQIFVREDREQEAKFGSRFDRGGGGGGSYGGGFGGGPRGHPGDFGRGIFVGNLPYVVAWQDLKDLFRQAGPIVRADVNEGPDRRSKGTGQVIFENPQDVHNAISMFSGYEWHGRRLEVRELGGGGGGGGPMMGGGRPYGGGYREYPPYDPRDYYRGGYDPYAYGGYGYGYDRGYGGPPPPHMPHPMGRFPPPPPRGYPPPPPHGRGGDFYKDYPPPPPPPPGGPIGQYPGY